MPALSTAAASSGIAILALLCLVGVLPTAAASIDPSTARVWHIGDTLPLTFYIRLRRQTGGMWSFLMGGGTAEKDDNDRPVLFTTQSKTNGEVGDRVAWEEGRIPLLDEADHIGLKHPAQTRRSIPPEYAPRIGINRVVSLPVKAWWDVVARQIDRESLAGGFKESDLALRVSVGSGLTKETTWFPVAAVRKQLADSPIFDFMTAHDKALLASLGIDHLEKSLTKEEVVYLSELHFAFGVHVGAVVRLTSLHVECSYVPSPGDVLQLRYTWAEHRPYNPHRGITLCCIVVILVATVMAVRVLSGTNHVAAAFARKAVVVRREEDD